MLSHLHFNRHVLGSINGPEAVDTSCLVGVGYQVRRVRIENQTGIDRLFDLKSLSFTSNLNDVAMNDMIFAKKEIMLRGLAQATDLEFVIPFVLRLACQYSEIFSSCSPTKHTVF